MSSAVELTSSGVFLLDPIRVAVRKLSIAHPRTLQSYSYGTSGFRALASHLDAVTLRMGMLAALRSWKAAQDAGKCVSGAESSSSSSSSSCCPIVGVMVTASHNDEPDNGIKLIVPTGEMLATAWEGAATTLANAGEEEVGAAIERVMHELSVSTPPSQCRARIFVGRDTRPSSSHLSELLIAGAKSLDAEVVDYGLCTTPQLHWLVKEANSGHDATIDAYYQRLSESFKVALECRIPTSKGPHPAPCDPTATHHTSSSSSSSSLAQSSSDSQHTLLAPLIVDCANGVGAESMRHLAPLIQKQLQVTMRNAERKGLNHQCGAEHVQKSRSLPLGFDVDSDRGKKLASIDGDADRLVYFYLRLTDGAFRLLDGDKTIALYTQFLTLLLRTAGLADQLSVGIVQTAYANGASTIYMRDTLHLPVTFTNTGVKHLHHKAVEYDVGIYFESNGHGTVVFSNKARQTITQAAHNTQQSPEQHDAARCLHALMDLINQCVGDAISDMLLVEVALHHLGWSLSDWDSLYDDLPSSMLKVRVADRSVITTTDAERRCVNPVGLQDAIDRLVANGPDGKVGVRRAFVRPSGTEDIVRVYAEASTREEVDVLAKQVCETVSKLAGGIE